MALKKTMIYLDPEDHRALFERALDESRRQGRRVTMAEMIREAVKTYLTHEPEITRKSESPPTKKTKSQRVTRTR